MEAELPLKEEEPPLTPQSNNKAPLADLNITASGASIPDILKEDVAGDRGEVGIEVIRTYPTKTSTPTQTQPQSALEHEHTTPLLSNNGDQSNALSGANNVVNDGEEDGVNKSYSRNMSALSVSTGEEDLEEANSTGAVGGGGVVLGGVGSSYEEELELPDTPKSSLVSSKKNMNLLPTGVPEDTIAPLPAQPMSGGYHNNSLGRASKAVDWIPSTTATTQQQQQHNQHLSLNKTSGSLSGATSQAVKLGADDVTETSFTTMTTVGELDNTDRVVSIASGLNGVASSPAPIITSNPPPSATAGGGRSGRSSRAGRILPARSPRPPRHMRAVDWCPPSSTPHSSTNAVGVASGSGGTSSGGVRLSGSSAGGASNTSSAAMASDKTAVTSRAVRLGDDATVTTFATMTTMGDGGSILEADTEDEASSTSEASRDDDGSQSSNIAGEEDEDETKSMEDVKDQDGVVDKIPMYSKSAANRNMLGSLSGTTNHAIRAADDQSVVTFATMTTAGGMMDRSSSNNMVDKVPSFAPPRMAGEDSIVTNDTVQMGDNASLATWATTNTMGGAITGNVVDHVPEDNDQTKVASSERRGDVDAGAEEGEEESSNITVGTSNAVKDDPSVTTFTTATTTNDSAINEVVDKIPIFAGGTGGRTSSISGVTNQALRGSVGVGGNAVGFVPDDRSVASFATMTTMGDLGSIYETEVYEEHDNNNDHDDLRPRLFSGEINRAVVDVIPEAASSVASGTTNHSVRTTDNESVTTFGSVTTAGLRGDPQSVRESSSDREENIVEGGNGDVVDKVPTYPNEGGGRSMVSGVTNQAVRIDDDQSVATWATSATSGMLGHVNEHVVDKTPSMGTSGGDMSGAGDDGTNQAVKDPEDQSVVTWNTMTTAGVASRVPPLARSPPPNLAQTFAVDRVPSFSNQRALSMSGTTNHALRGTDDQSVVTFATMTTVGGMDRGGQSQDVVDKVPSFVPNKGDTSIVTNDTVQMGDNQSLATWATTNTMGGAITGNVVDHVPPSSADEEESSHITLGTSNAIKEDPSVTTFTTSATGVSRVNEVVDNIPTFAGGGGGLATAGRSVTSGVTNQAVRMGDDRSVTSLATMTTMGGNSVFDAEITNMDANPGRSGDVWQVDRIPSMSDANRGGVANNSIVSGRTDNAVRLGDDLTVTTFATMTTAGGGEGSSSSSVQRVAVGSDQENNDANSGISISSSSRAYMAPAPAPTTGILRESRHRPALKDNSGREYRTSLSDSATTPAAEPDIPINAGESVSNTHILRAIADLRFHVDYRMGELRELNCRDSERVLQVVQQEQAKRTALEARLHAQLLLQSESMVAMELKLLRVEAKAAQRDSRRQRGRQPGIGGTAPAIDRLPPIAATPSTPNQSQSDEEVDSFEELELTPRGTNRHGLGSGLHVGGMMHRGGMGPANIAVVTRSGASVASAVTATSFQEGDLHVHDGDIEDEGDDNDDGSASTPTHGSRNRISNLESILLNPIQASGSNEQGISTRAVRGDTDGMSSLPTVSTVVTAATTVTGTTRGESVGITRISSRTSDDDALRRSVAEEEDTTTGILRAAARNMRSNSDDFDMSAEERGHQQSERRASRSRSHSPLTVQSEANMTAQSLASASLGPSLGPSILSTAAVASSRSFGTRRANAAAAIAANVDVAGSRSMADRVVSFTTNDFAAGAQLAPPQENDGGGDSITMPDLGEGEGQEREDELDNFSDIADAFSNSARVWREEYESRLDAIHKRLGS